MKKVGKSVGKVSGAKGRSANVPAGNGVQIQTVYLIWLFKKNLVVCVDFRASAASWAIAFWTKVVPI